MKHRTLWKGWLGVSAMILLLAGTAVQVPAEPSPPPADTNSASVAEGQKTSSQKEIVATAPTPDTDAPARLVSESKTLPPNIRPTSPVAEVIKLANSGLDESVMLAFVTNSAHTFNLGAEEIIYLNDIGVPGSVVTAMIQRDEVLKTMLATGAGGSPPTEQPPGPPSATDPAQMSIAGPTPDQMAPPPPDNGPAYAAEAPLTPPDTGDDEMFFDSLAPYGNWVDVAGYGHCWQPTVVVVDSGWQPYFNCGHWVYSDCGWYWLSDYSWGWAPFHYGSWFRHGRLGWCWVPGRTWGPSWVSWRYNDHYCGWAPLPPGARFAVGAGLTFHGQRAGDSDDFGLRPGHFRFVDWGHFNDRHFSSRGASPNEARRIFETTTVATRITGDNHTVINNGLPVSRVAAATHRPVTTVVLRETSQPVPVGGRAERFEPSGRTLAVYRPNPEQPPRMISRQGDGNSAGGSGRTSTSASAWGSRNGNSQLNETTRNNNNARTPLVIRGPQSAARGETPPPNSLIVIGRRADGLPATPTQPWTPATRPNANAPEANSRTTSAAPEVQDPVANDEHPQENWMGTVASSPQPAWFAGSGSSAANRINGAVPAPRPEARGYQPVPRSFTPQVPRYDPSPSYTPQRSYSAPARSPSFESRPAPSAPSAPSAPAASHSSSTQSSNRNGR